MSDKSIVFIESLQKYFFIKEESIATPSLIHNTRPINRSDASSFQTNDILISSINNSSISQEDKTALIGQLNALFRFKYLDISLVALKKYCDNSYLSHDIKEKAQESLKQIQAFNKLNKEFKKKFLSLSIAPAFEKVEREYVIENGQYKRDSRGAVIIKSTAKPLEWEALFLNNKKLTKNSQEGYDYAINHSDKVLDSVLSAREYQSQTDSSYVVYVNSGSHEGFFNKNQYNAPFNQAQSFHDAKSAERACSARRITHYQIWQTSSKFIKQMSSNCNTGPALQAIISEQERQFIEDSMKLQEVVDMKNKIEKYEKLLQDNGIAYESEQVEKKHKVNKL